MPLFVVNSELDARDRRVPVVQPSSWVGNIYQKGGNVYKYLMLTPDDISGQPGVFGPVPPEDVQAAIDADGGTLRGWTIEELPEWASEGWDMNGPIPAPVGDV